MYEVTRWQYWDVTVSQYDLPRDGNQMNYKNKCVELSEGCLVHATLRKQGTEALR
jgi:hypothetical protein